MTLNAAAYRKAMNAKATVGESSALAWSAAQPAIVGARFSILLSVASFVVSAIALAVALWR